VSGHPIQTSVFFDGACANFCFVATAGGLE
jgi:hypothetical protein